MTHNLLVLLSKSSYFQLPVGKNSIFLGQVSIFQQTFPPESSINSLQNRNFPSFLCLCRMGALGNDGFWWKFPPRGLRFRSRRSRSSSSSNGSDHPINGGGSSFNFPLKSATTAASLALAGDTIAQIRDRYKLLDRSDSKNKVVGRDVMSALLSNYDWLRALRMTSYGFLLYGPGSHAWYQYLDHRFPKPTFGNLSMKVLLNQIVLGPCVIAVVFAWNNLWQGKLSQLPAIYQKDALPTLLYGFRFWIPVSVLNFWVVPLQTRVAFMSTCAIFWNFCLSSTMSK